MSAKKEKEKRIKLLLVDDHPIVLEGIRSYLASQSRFEVAGEAGNGLEAIKLAKELQPDIILLDVSMPEMNGISAMGQLRRKVPSAKILVLSMHNNREYIMQMIQSGARGYVLKDSPPSELIRAIQLVYSGEVFFSPSASQVLMHEAVKRDASARELATVKPLSNREREVLKQVAEGQSNKGIAGELGVSVRTVETHRERVMRKLGIRSIAGLTKYAITNGLVEL